jgi:glycosyltransferase involved in cell wall biosynthesis/tetratricopeptide (TPR) repeat protein
MKLTILMPVYNERAHLRDILQRVVGQLTTSSLTGLNAKKFSSFEILCVDDCSTDGSREYLESLEANFFVEFAEARVIRCEFQLIKQDVNCGKGAAIRKGFDASRGDFVLIQDADLEYSPSDYDELLRPLIDDQADATYGSRFLKGEREVRWLSFIQRFANIFLTWLFNFVSATQITDVETCYKVLKGDLARSLRLNSNRFGIELEITARLSRLGARILEVPIHYHPRTFEQGKKIGTLDGLAALFHIFRYNVFDTQPFRAGARLARFQPRPRVRTLALLVFTGALLIRLGFVAQWFKTAYGYAPLLDALAYDEWARSLLDGHFLRDKAFYQSPLYPYWLAGVYKIFGHDFHIVSILQAILGALTCAILSVVTVRSFGEWAGLAAGVLAIFYRPLIFYTAPAMKETLGLFLLTLFILFAAAALKKKRKRDFVYAGAALGLTALVRGNALVLWPVLGVFALIAMGFSRKSLLRFGAFSLVMALMIFPATLHNYLASQDFVLLNYTSGFNFYMGSSSTTTGANAYPPDVSSEPGQEELDVTRIAERSVGHPLKPSEVSQFWFQRGLQYIQQNPMHQLASLLNKTLYFWNDFEQPDNYDINFVAKEMPTLLGWPLVGFGLLSILSAFGLVATWREQKIESHALFAMGTIYAASVLIYYVTDRYRIPVVLFMFPFAGASLPAAVQAWHQRRYSTVTLAGLGALPFILLAYQPIPLDLKSMNAFNWGVVSSAYSDQKMDHEAIAAFQKGFAIHPKSVDSEALIKTSTSFERLGDLREAARLLQLACDLHPLDALNPYNLGRFKFEHGDAEGSLVHFKKAQKLAPWNHLPYIGLAAAYLQTARLDRALMVTREGLKIAPESPELRLALKQIETRSAGRLPAHASDRQTSRE